MVARPTHQLFENNMGRTAVLFAPAPTPAPAVPPVLAAGVPLYSVAAIGALLNDHSKRPRSLGVQHLGAQGHLQAARSVRVMC